ncbi:MAG TPA: RloB family protein [Daejeonella sp.]|uniref:RloB family protein n=1 Tax=Daejeonella sp. TaxID=2805397 RepID=UPI002D84736C|nr:RloB family protein [Flavobacterium sp.]
MMRINRPISLKIRPTFAIVVDGDCEVWYLQMLKRNERSILVNIEPKIPQRKRLSEQFEIVIKLSEDYTKVFWIVDFDVIALETRNAKIGSKSALQSFLEYRKTIAEKYKNIIIIVNNPCLEFWLLLHFEETSKYFETCEGAERQLKKYLKDYEKTQKYYTKQDKDIYLRLKTNLVDALKNSKALKLFDTTNPNKGMSEMHFFFEASEFGQLFRK